MKPKATLRAFLAMAGSSFLAVTAASAGTYYWDSDGDATPGFGATAGTWAAAGTGNLWSTSPEGNGVGGAAVADYPTTTDDDLFFGTGPTGAIPPLYNYIGTTTISGTVNAKSIYQSANHPNFSGTTPTINFAAVGSYETAKANTAFPATTTISGAATSLTWKIALSNTLNISNVTSNAAAQNILQGPGRLAINSMTPLGASSTPLVFDGGVLRFATGFPVTATYPSVTSFNTVHPITFNLNKDAGLDNQIGGSTFTVDVPLNLGTGGFSVEGNGAAIIALNQANTYTGPTTLTGAIASVETSANLGAPSSNLVFNGGTLRITGTTLTSFSTIGHTVVFNATRSVNLNIDEALHTFAVDTVLNQTTGGFAKTGAGTVNLNQTSNSYTGTTNVSAGTLNVSNIPVAVSGLTSVSGTGTLNLSGDNSASTGGVTLTAGTLNLNSTSALGTGTCTLTGGTLKNSVNTLSTTHPVTFGAAPIWDGVNNLTFGTGAISIPANSTMTLNGTGSVLTFGGVLTNTQAGNPTLTANGAGNTLVISGGFDLSNSASNRTPVISGTGNVTINGPVTNGVAIPTPASACALTKTGTGTLTLNGNNTYDGLTTHSTAGSTLTLAGDNSGAAGGITLGNATAVLNLNHAAALGTGTFTLTTGIINNTSGSAKILTTNNVVNIGGNFTFSGSNNLTFGNGAVSNNGSRTFTLNGTGSTLAFGGQHINTLANNQTTTVTGAGNTLSVGGWALSNSVSAWNGTITGTGNVTINGAVVGSSLGGSETIASTLTYSGTGTLTLNGGANTYSGATLVNSTGCLALVGGSQNSAITVNSGAFIGFTLGQSTTSTKAVTLSAGHKVRITGTPTPGVSYTLLTTSSSIGGVAPDIETPLGSHSLVVEGSGTTLILKSNSTPFQDWAVLKGLDGTVGKENGKTDDPDGDGKNNNFEFAFNGDPLSGSDNGMMAGLVQDASLPAGNELTLVVAVRDGATFSNAGSPVVQTATVDGVTYTIQGTLDLVTIPGSDVSHASGPSNTAPLATGLPDLTGADWEYHTFKLDASEGLGSQGFLRAKAE